MITTTGGVASVYPPIGVPDPPFAFPNISATRDVFNGPFGDSGGFFAISNSKRRIKEPRDRRV